MVRLVDTSVVIYRYDARDPVKQAIAADLLRRGAADGSLVLAHQTVAEFVRAATWGMTSAVRTLEMPEAVRIAGNLMSEFDVIFPTEQVLRTAMMGVALHPLSWYDAHMWAHAEANGIPELLSEEFQNGRMYGSVRVRNPFLDPAFSTLSPSG